MLDLSKVGVRDVISLMRQEHRPSGILMTTTRYFVVTGKDGANRPVCRELETGLAGTIYPGAGGTEVASKARPFFSTKQQGESSGSYDSVHGPIDNAELLQHVLERKRILEDAVKDSLSAQETFDCNLTAFSAAITVPISL